MIIVLTSCDSERHLSRPILEELKITFGSHNAEFIDLPQNNVPGSYNIVDFYIKAQEEKDNKVEFVLAVGDRPEQVGGVLAAFHNKKPIGHLFAGDINQVTTTYDDIHRNSITLYSSIQFCSSREALCNIIKTKSIFNKRPYFVGATHFDGMNLQEVISNTYGLLPQVPYVLILINSETLGNDKQLVEEAAREAMMCCNNNCPNFIIAKGNGDNEEIETMLFTKIKTDSTITIVRENRKDHKFFLSLMHHCDRFITNSSAAIYEAPFLMDMSKIIYVGNRNKFRTKVEKEAHSGNASYIIAMRIAQFLEMRL